MQTKIFKIVAMGTLVFSLLACNLGNVATTISGTDTPQPTYTSVPTEAPLPTATPKPTDTPLPLPTAVPTSVPVAGIDFPIEVGDSTTFLITRVELSDSEYTLIDGTTKMIPGSGKSVLVVWIKFTGDAVTSFKTLLQGKNTLYVSDANNNSFSWQHAVFTQDGILQVGFMVKSNAGPYLLSNNIGTSWSIDLSKVP